MEQPAVRVDMMQTTFQRNNLRFSYITTADLPDIVRMLEKESVCRHLSFGPNTEQETRAYFEPLIESIRSSLGRNELPSEHIFTIREENGEFVGQCALLPIQFSLDNYAVAFTIDDSCWRRGFGKKACRFLIDYAFRTLNAARLSGGCFDENNGSRRVMEKCGFVLEGRQRHYWQKSDEVYDNLLFGLLKKEFEEMSPKQLLSRWIDFFNKADAAGLAELYHDDAINHQVANEPVEGKENIRNMFEREFAAVEMVCIVENLLEDGEWAILEWKDPLGLRGCGFFHVVDGTIKFQRGYWDKLSFLRQHGIPLPAE